MFKRLKEFFFPPIVLEVAHDWEPAIDWSGRKLSATDSAGLLIDREDNLLDEETLEPSANRFTHPEEPDCDHFWLVYGAKGLMCASGCGKKFTKDEIKKMYEDGVWDGNLSRAGEVIMQAAAFETDQRLTEYKLTDHNYLVDDRGNKYSLNLDRGEMVRVMEKYIGGHLQSVDGKPISIEPKKSTHISEKGSE